MNNPHDRASEEEWAWWSTLSIAGATRARLELEGWLKAIKEESYEPLTPETHRVRKGGRPRRSPPTSSCIRSTGES
jgi:hypothetical protein